MAENVVLSVQLNGAEAALSQLTQLDGIVKSLNASKNIKINVSANGITSAANQAEKLSTNLTEAENAAQQIGTTGSRAVNEAGTALQKASRNAESFNLGMGSVVLNMAKFRLASAAVNLVFNAFSGAVKEMKAVDSELVNIRKVTGFTDDQIKKLTKSAYSMATAYGRSASEVLEAETVFARAGYTEQIEQLSKLSLLLQNAGDLTAEDAAKFLIATDKAYKLGGSYEALMAIIDGLDNITNKNATDMQKMTDGMTIAGSVFAEAGESVEMFAALLGTATANTQRSGSEVARALRTILMNLRQIQGETEDGELIDGESIAKASKALKEYAGISTMENGELRKASDVLAELAGKWDDLSETQRAAIAEAVAGKRQANVLMALMGDWESVEKMLFEYENAAGTAAAENAVYMESWAAKLEQVKASWNEFVASLMDSDGIKSLLDLGMDFLGLLKTIFESPLVNRILTAVKDVVSWVIGAADKLIEALDYYFSDYDSKEEKAEKDKEEAEQNAVELREAYERDFGAGSRYEELTSRIHNLTEAEMIELGVLEAKRKEREKEVEAAEAAAKAAAEALEKARAAREESYNAFLSEDLTNVSQSFAADQDVELYKQNLTEIIAKYADYYNELMNVKAAGGELTAQQQQFVTAYELAARTLTEGGNAVEVYGKITAAAAIAAGASTAEAAAKANGMMDILASTMDEIPEFVPITVSVNGFKDTMAKLELIKSAVDAISSGGMGPTFAFPGFASGVHGAPGGPALVNEKGPELISAHGLAWIAGGGKPTVTMLPKGATVLTAAQTRQATGGRTVIGIPAFEDGTDAVWQNLLDNVTDSVYGAYAAEQKNAGNDKGYQYFDADDLTRPGATPSSQNGLTAGAVAGAVSGFTVNATASKERKKKQNGAGQGGGGTGAEGGGEGGVVPPDFEAREKELSERLKNLDMQAELAENEEDFLRAMQVYGEAQEYIAELLELYRANGYAEDSDEVLRLANLGYDYAAKQLGGYDDLQERLIDALNELTEATDDANKLQERQEAVDKARETLANAERQRTVRIFNPVTGQWEWVANASDVQKAQESLKSAEEALRKEELSQAVNAIKNADPADLAGLTLSPAILEALFGGTPEQQTAFLNALGAATGGADYMASDEARTAWNQGTSIGTQYNLAGITLTESQAAGMTIQELLNMLRGLKIL